LQGEIKEALELWDERLDRDGYLIPLRLDDAASPARLAHLQWIDFSASDGWGRLLAAIRMGTASSGKRRIRKRLKIAGAAVGLLAVALLPWLWPSGYRSQAAAFATARVDSQAAAPGGPPRLGLTLWKADPTRAGGNPGSYCAELGLTRAALGTELRRGEFVRLGVESSHPGYLYILNREATGQNTTDWQLIYPSTRMRSGNNAVRSGALIEIPPDDQVCATFALNPTNDKVEGEQLAFLITSEPVSELSAKDSGHPVESSVIDRWRERATRPASTVSSDETVGAQRSAAEDEASTEGKRYLTYNEALPQTILTFPEDAKSPLWAEVTLRLANR
jgi:hypothetical protein